MLSQANRLKKDREFKRVHKEGKFFGSHFLALKIAPNNLKDTRFGIIVGTKVSKKAVDRNKAKRRLREAIRQQLPQIKPGFDVVLMVKPEITSKDYQEIVKTVFGLLKKSRLL